MPAAKEKPSTGTTRRSASTPQRTVADLRLPCLHYLVDAHPADAECLGDLRRTEASGLIRAPGGRAFIAGGRKKCYLADPTPRVAVAFCAAITSNGVRDETRWPSCRGFCRT